MSRGHADPARASLDAEVLRWMREPDWREDEGRFDRLARALFAFQFERCAAYRGFCERRDRTPDRVTSWREIPAVPTGAFKELTLTSFPASRTLHTFRTSGTSVARRGALHLDTLEVYEASLIGSFRRHVLPDLPAPHGRLPLHVLAPCCEEAPDSSLSHMFGAVLRAFGTPESGFAVHGGSLRVEALLPTLEAAAAQARPIALCGTAFAFVHLLDALASRGLSIALPGGSRVMETGGFKGRSRAMSRDELYAEIGARLGIPSQRIVNQYGMTELGSQFYDSVLRRPGEPRRKLGPPWARVRLVVPETGEVAARGATGVVVIVDLANTGSVLALETADLGRALPGGFEVLGRAPGAEERGCSVAADALLSGTSPA